MEQMSLAKLKEKVNRIRKDHHLKKRFFIDTDQVRDNGEIDQQLMDAGKMMVVAKFVGDFWRHANDAVLFLRTREADTGNAGLEGRFMEWLGDSAAPFMGSLFHRIRVIDWDDLISLYYIMDNRIKALSSVGEPELPVFVIETIHTLEKKLTGRGLLRVKDAQDHTIRHVLVEISIELTLAHHNEWFNPNAGFLEDHSDPPEPIIYGTEREGWCFDCYDRETCLTREIWPRQDLSS